MGDIGKSFGLSREEVAILKDQAARRAVNRQLFLKKCYDPHRSDAYVFDAGLQRFNAMMTYRNEHFRPTPKTSVLGIILLVIPFSIYTYIVYRDRRDKEHAYRTGQVAYKDRPFKFV